MELEEIVVKPENTIRESDFGTLYKDAFPIVTRLVYKMKGTTEDAIDIFHDALILYAEKDREGKLPRHDPVPYLLGIVKHLWIRRFHVDRKLVSMSDTDHQISIPPEFLPSVDTTRLLNFLERTGKKCLDLLHAHYFEKKNVTELSRSLHYRNEHSVSVQKYKCIEKLRDLIKVNSACYEDFLE